MEVFYGRPPVGRLGRRSQNGPMGHSGIPNIRHPGMTNIKYRIPQYLFFNRQLKENKMPFSKKKKTIKKSRNVWTINPVTKIKESKKIYKRPKSKKEVNNDEK